MYPQIVFSGTAVGLGGGNGDLIDVVFQMEISFAKVELGKRFRIGMVIVYKNNCYY